MRELIIGLIGIVLGSVLTFGWTYLLALQERQWTANSLAAAYVGDISTSVKPDIRKTEFMAGLLRNLELGVVWEPRGYVPDRPPVLYQATADQLGLLGPDFAEQITTFYRMEMRSQENLRHLNDGTYMSLKDDDKKFFLNRSIALEEKIVDYGSKLVSELRQMYDLK